MHDRRRTVDLDVADKTAVDLDLVEREPLQIAEGRKAGAEIVQRDADTNGAKLMQDRQRALVVMDQHRLGDFDLEPLWRQARGGECARDPQRQRRRLQLDRRDVDGQPDMRRPAGGLGTGGLHDPVAEFVDQPGVLGNRDELRRGNHAAFRMAPAQQRLAARHLAAREIQQRLVVEFEAAIGQCLAKILLHGEPRLGAGVHGRFEEPMGPAATGLGGVHREVGVLDQLIEFGAVLRRQRDADAGIGREMMAETVVRLPDRLVNPRDEFHDVGAVADTGPDHRKFIASQPGDQVGWFEAVLDAGGHGLQQFVADMVPERIVDTLELVDVDVEQGERPAGILKLALDPLAEQHPVRKIGQRVVMRQMCDPFIGKPALGYVVDDVDDVARLTCGIADRQPPGRDVTLPHRRAFPGALVLEQAIGGLQCFFVIGRDAVGKGFRKDVKSRLADDQVARIAELDLGHAVDQQVAAVAHVLHGDLGRDVIDDLAQEGVVAVALLFEPAAVGDVLHRGDPAAVCQRLADRHEGTPVRALHDAVIDPVSCDVSHDGGAKSINVAVERAGILAMLHQVAEMATRLHDIGRQAIHVDVAAVEGHDARRGVERHQALDHVVQGGVEPAPFRFDPSLGLAALAGDLADHQE